MRNSRGALVPAYGTWALFPNRVFLAANQTYVASIDGRLCGVHGRCAMTRRTWRFATASGDGSGKGDTRVPSGFVRPN